MTENITTSTSSIKQKLPSKKTLIRSSALVAIGVVGTVGFIALTKKAPVLDVAAAVADTAV